MNRKSGLRVSVSVRIDMGEFQATLTAYMSVTRRDLAEVMNQRLANVVHWTLEGLPPHTEPSSKRAQIRDYLNTQLTQKVRQTARGHFTKRGRKDSQLRRVHLIVQARNKRRGRSGLYGNTMRRASAAFRRHSINSVGFAKAMFIPIVRAMNPLVRFKIPFRLTSGIAIWSRPAGGGTAHPAREGGPTVAAMIHLRADTRYTNESFYRNLIENALERGVARETSEMRAQIEKRMQERVDSMARR